MDSNYISFIYITRTGLITEEINNILYNSIGSVKHVYNLTLLVNLMWPFVFVGISPIQNIKVA